MSTRNLPGGNFTAVCLDVEASTWVSTACYRDSFTLCRVLSRWLSSFTQLFKRLSVFEPRLIAENCCTAEQSGPLDPGDVFLPLQHGD
jgi:hypothetical protein